MNSYQRIFHILIGLILFLSLSSGAQAASERTLTLLFTNDTHNRLESFHDVELDKNVGGIIRRSRYFEEIRKQNPMSLILDAGDAFQGTPYYNFYLGEADIRAMNLMGYDVMTVGNHDMDNGIENLKKQTQYAQFPLLNANIIDQKTGLLIFRPFHIFDVHGIKVAVIGLISEHAWQAVATSNKEGYAIKDPFTVANELVSQLRPQVDLIISLNHMGIWDDEILPQKVAGIDIILGGHSHTMMKEAKLIKNGNQNGIGGTLMQHAFTKGVYVGRLDITLDEEGQITHYDTKAILVDERFDPRPLEDMLHKYGEKLEKSMGEVIGTASASMSTEGKYNGPFALGSLLADMIKESADAEVGIMNTGGVRSGLLKGPISVGAVYEIMPFDNAVSTLEMQGKELKKIVIENTQRLGVSKNMQFSGLVYQINGKNVTEIKINGKKLEMERWYTIAAPDYVVLGNEAISFESGRKIRQTGQLIRDIMIQYIRQHKTIHPPQDQRLIRMGSK